MCCGLRAQTGVLKGTVTEEATGETLPGATIQLVSNMAKGAATDIDGRYYLELDTGMHVLVCGFVGLGSDTFRVHITNNNVTEHNMRLKPVAKLLETVVVSSGKFDQKIEELTVSMEVIKPNLINNKNTTSIETALEQAPGLSVIDNDPQIRGGSGFTFGVGSRVAIVVDGIPLLSGDAGRPEWTYIPVENIEQVEIIKGASSVLYGSSAINGVINIRTAYPRSKPKTLINYSVGAYSLPKAPASNWYGKSAPGYTNLNILHSRIIKNNLDLVVGGNFNMDQGYIGPAPDAPYMPPLTKKGLLITDSIYTYTNDDMRKVRARFNFNLRYRSQKYKGLSYGVNGNSMYNKTNMVLAWLDDSLGLYRGYPGAVFLQTQTLFNIDPFIKYHTANGISHSLVTRFFYSRNDITNNMSNQGNMYFGEYQLQRIFKELDFTFTGGVSTNVSQSKSSLYASSGSPNNHIVNASGYIQLDKKFWKIVTLSGGFRYEYFRMNKQQSVVAPIFRAGTSIQVMKGTFVRLSYGQGFRYPTINQRYITTKSGMFGVFANPSLQPEKSYGYEMGLKQGFRIGNVTGYFDVAGFYQEYQNTIEFLFGVWDPSISLVGFKFVNTGSSRVRGVDMSLAVTSPETNKKFGITALVGYTYIEPVSLEPNYVYATTKNFQGGDGEQLSYKTTSLDTTDNVLKYRFKHMVKADVEFRIFRFGFGVSYRYYSRMQNIDSAYSTIQKVTYDAQPYLYEVKGVRYWKSHDGFNIFDARLSYRIHEKHKLSLICSNVFNVDYSLRPMKIEAPRTTSLQYVYTF